jgi:phosphatidylglycerophosphate synthase
MPAIRELNPSYFALVMATGIVARATRLDDVLVLSDALLATALLAFVMIPAWLALAAWAVVAAAMAAAALRRRGSQE